MSETVECPYCEGKGHQPLKETLAETLGLLRRQPGEVNGTALAGLAGLDLSTMNNRLFALEQMGLASSRYVGVIRVWNANREAE